MALRATEENDRRVLEISAAYQAGTLSVDERIELHEHLLAEELIGLAKAHALRKLKRG